jgi:hypothetical protein
LISHPAAHMIRFRSDEQMDNCNKTCQTRWYLVSCNLGGMAES